MTQKVNDFLKDNVKAIIAIIFTLGAFSTTSTMQQVTINEMRKQISELEKNKVSYSVLELKQKTLNGRLETIEGDVETLDARVRRKLDGSLKSTVQKTNDLEVTVAVQEQRMKQSEDERKGIWKFINKFLEKIH